MTINGAKSKIISPSDKQIVIDGEEAEHVQEFVFLGSVEPKSAKDVIRCIGVTSTAFGRLREAIWNKKSISNALKIRLCNALIVTIAIYGSEIWTLRSRERADSRAILGVTRKKKLRNEHIRKALQMKTKSLKW